MKKILLLSFVLLSFTRAQAQSLLSWTPSFPKEVNSGNLTIVMDATKGNAGLLNTSTPNNIWLHLGVITNKSTSSTNWKYVLTTWPATTPGFNATSLGNNKFSFTINNSNLRTYFNITDPTEKIVKIALLFRNAAGTAVQRNSDGSDMYIPVDTTNTLQTRFVTPTLEPRYIPWVEPITATVGQTFPVKALASANCNMTLYLNGTQIATANNVDSIVASPTLSQACNNQLVVVASNGTTTKSDTINFFVGGGSANFAALPAGVKDGINYNGNNSVTLVLYAPKKNSVVLLGSHNNWVAGCSDIMNRTPDSLRHWITLNNLTPGTVYKFQYVVDNTIVTADPYCEMILDPWNDQYITPANYPNMPTYPAGRSGIVGTFTPGETPYTWTTTNYVRPDKKGLVIYELLLRDFIKSHDWKGLTDSLNYLSKLGVNCIQVMPFTEFDGNESWGYNPNYYFAPDKYYGPKNDLKKFIDLAHSKGMAVVLDATFNHTTGLSPLAQLYWNASTNKPTPDNPWLNVDPKHDFNVFNDFNHESEPTKYYVARFIRHWLTEYKLDGFRWDLSKGFTQNNTLGNIGAWSQYDASRVAIWKRYYDSMQAVSNGSYCILEHFSENSEESVLANYGMLIWGKLTDEHKQNVMGYNSSNSLDYGYFKNRPGYNHPHLITYAESHDEERIMYNTLLYGNGNAKTLNNALQRFASMHAVLLSIPGPKMIWQFGELGYDFSINTCSDSANTNPLTTSVNSNCRLAKKPIRWDYFSNPTRKNVYNTIAGMNDIRNKYPSLFQDANITTGTFLGNSLVKKVVASNNDLGLVTVANFELNDKNNEPVTFPSNGWWYNYFDGDSINVSNSTYNMNITSGGFKVYTNKKINTKTSGTQSIQDLNTDLFNNMILYPNPTKNQANLQFYSLGNAELKINLIDATGKVIREFLHKDIDMGDYTIELNNLSDFQPGLYWIMVSANGVQKALPITIE